MNITKAVDKINNILRKSHKEGDSMVMTLDKLSIVKCHGVVFPRIMLVEIMNDFVDNINKEEKEPKMQDSFDRAERKWSDSVN
tara:strand:- start:195 stop:443 length:249 start_codon:yes stop_codon:yes gene_type:complete